MIRRALAALALGGTLFILLTGAFHHIYAQQNLPVTPDLIDRYRATLSADPGNLTLHYLLGVALLKDQQNAAALQELQIAYPAYQESVEAHYNLAIAALRLSDLDSAEIFLDQAVELGADDLPGIYPISELYFNMALKSREYNDANEAIRYFHKVLSFDPKRFEVFRQLGDLYAQQNDTDLAIKSFHSYLERFPDDAVSREYLFALEFNRAQDRLAAEEFGLAADGFTRALEIQPGSPTALYYLGYIAYVEDKPGLAAKLLNQAFAAADEPLRQTIRPLLYNSALELRKQDKPLAALKISGQLADDPKAQFNELFLAGTLTLELGSHRTAYEYLQRAVLLEPSHQGAQQNLLAAELGAFDEWVSTAKIELAKGELDKAEHALQQAEALQPQNMRVVSTRKQLEQKQLEQASVFLFNAQAALNAGDITTAFSQLEKALEVQPNNPDGLLLRSELLAAQSLNLDKLILEAENVRKEKQWAEATRLYQRVLAVSPQHPEAQEGIAQIELSQRRESAELLTKGQKALDAGQPDVAIDAFEQLLTKEPGNILAQKALAEAKQLRTNRLSEFLMNGRKELGRKKYAEARQWFNKAMALDESSSAQAELSQLERQVVERADALSLQAEEAVVKKHYKEAEQLFAHALKLVPGHATAAAGQAALRARTNQVIETYLLRGNEALELGDNLAATSAFRSVLEIAPDNSAALSGLKMSREQQVGQLEEMIRLGQQALEAGKFTEAEQHLAEALNQDAYHKEAQQLKQRLEQVRQSGAQPGDEQKLYLQGVAFYTQGKYPEAIQAWEKVLLLKPGHEKATLNIEKTKRKLRQIEEYRGS